MCYTGLGEGQYILSASPSQNIDPFFPPNPRLENLIELNAQVLADHGVLVLNSVLLGLDFFEKNDVTASFKKQEFYIGPPRSRRTIHAISYNPAAAQMMANRNGNRYRPTMLPQSISAIIR